MRHPEKWLRVLGGLTLIVGIVVAVAGRSIWLYGDVMPESAIVGVGAVVLVVLLIFDLMLWKVARHSARARQPDHHIADWHLRPETWEAFLTLDAERRAEARGISQVFKPRARSAAVEVVAARSGILVDGLFLGLEPRGLNAMTGVHWLPGRPECLEFSVLVPIGSRYRMFATMPGQFRVPVEPTEREAAVTAFTYYRGLRAGGELSNPRGHRIAVRVALALGIVGIGVGGPLTWALANDYLASTSTNAVVALVGLLGGIGALFFALIVWLVMLKKR